VAGVSWHQEDADQTSQTTAFSDSIDTLVRNVIRPPTPDGTLFSFLDQVLQANGIPATLLGHRWTESMINRGEYRSAAVFGDAIWHVNERLNLSFGLRYSHDRKDFSWFNGRRDAPTLDATLAALAQAGFFDQVGLPVEMLMFDAVFDFGALEGQRVASSDSWSDLSPRFVVDYALSEQSMVFASLAKGYKAGGYNSVQPLSYFDNEEVWNLETGIKSEFDRLSIAASLFRYVYDNRQAIRLDPNTAGSGVPRYLVDISDEEAWGLDLALGWQVNEALRLRFDGAFIDAQFKDKLAPSGADLSGEPTGEPYLSLSTGGNYRWDLAANGVLELSLLHAYRGKGRCNADSRLQGDCQVSPNFSVGRAQQRTDLRLQWRSADGRWELGLYGNNVFDKRYVTDVNNLTTDVFGTPFANISPPRSYGVELKVAL
jgi:iron complex outermembrane recepter protein